MLKIKFIEKNDLAEICATADSLGFGEQILLEENHIMHNKRLLMSFVCDSLTEDDVIRLGHGENEWGGSYAELTSTKISVYEKTDSAKCIFESHHNLQLKGRVSINIDVFFNSVKITVESNNLVYETPVVNGWAGRNGYIFARGTKSRINNVHLTWLCSDYSRKIWLFGDSYFNTGSKARWPYYLLNDGHKNYLMSGFPGRDSLSAIKDFKLALTHGTPEIAVWCLGMNNSDNNNSINPDYLCATKEFLNLCNDNKITPILATIPCVPNRDNSHKNRWVKDSGYRYIDFAKAVDGENPNSYWYEGMLSSDLVHPDSEGAYALYLQVLADFPEIKSI